jgi:hypothetical protein
VVKDERGDILEEPHKIGGRITSVSYWKYRGRVVLGRLKSIQYSHLCQSRKWYKSPRMDQIPAKLIQSGRKHWILRYINLLSWTGTKRNCVFSGKSQLPYTFAEGWYNWLVFIGTYHCCQLHKNFIQHSYLYANSTCKWNYWG